MLGTKQVHDHGWIARPAQENRRILSAYQTGMDENNVCMTMSGTNALLNLFMTIINPGQNVLLPEPYFPSMVPMRPGGWERSTTRAYLSTNSFLKSRIWKPWWTRTVAILYNFPSNPTGGTSTNNSEMILAFAKKHDLWVISMKSMTASCLRRTTSPSWARP